MASTRTGTPVHDRPTIPGPANRVEEQLTRVGDGADRAICVVEHPPAAVGRLDDAAVPGAQPAPVGVEDRVARVAPPRPVQALRARHAHRVLAGRAAAAVARVQEVEVLLAAHDLRSLDDAGLPAAPGGLEDLAAHP